METKWNEEEKDLEGDVGGALDASTEGEAPLGMHGKLFIIIIISEEFSKESIQGSLLQGQGERLRHAHDMRHVGIGELVDHLRHADDRNSKIQRFRQTATATMR